MLRTFFIKLSCAHCVRMMTCPNVCWQKRPGKEARHKMKAQKWDMAVINIFIQLLSANWTWVALHTHARTHIQGRLVAMCSFLFWGLFFLLHRVPNALESFIFLFPFFIICEWCVKLINIYCSVGCIFAMHHCSFGSVYVDFKIRKLFILEKIAQIDHNLKHFTERELLSRLGTNDVLHKCYIRTSDIGKRFSSDQGWNKK